ncbi:hypothetical protein GTU99_07435 [Streptomyces sp. PRKS01-65]|nr:hypothetical protein [Streptomyces harenosi]NEY32027.1 hypothetical protein [Streptomyces harenosi]
MRRGDIRIDRAVPGTMPHGLLLLFGGVLLGAGLGLLFPSTSRSALNAPRRGSTSVLAVPHGLRDSEGAHEGEAVSPAFLIYGHEPIHAQHNMHGINICNIRDEEAATVTGNETSTALHEQRRVPVTTEEMLATNTACHAAAATRGPRPPVGVTGRELSHALGLLGSGPLMPGSWGRARARVTDRGLSYCLPPACPRCRRLAC